MTTPTTLDAMAVANAPLLRAIRAGGWETLSDLARGVERSPDNIHRDLGALKKHGWVDHPDGEAIQVAITDAAEAQLAMIERAEAGDDRVALPAGYVALTLAEIGEGHNARTDTGLDDASIDELADSFEQVGILEPIGVQPGRVEPLETLDDLEPTLVYPRAYGERRQRAWARLVERGVWPADHRELCRLVEGDARAVFIAGVVENAQREELTNLEYGEAFLAMERQFAMTPAGIAAAIGQGVRVGSRRSVQDLMKVAREATAADKAAFRAGAMTWTALRDTVGDKARKPTLDVPPMCRLALVETAHAALVRPADPGEVRGEPGYVRLARAWTGGPFVVLADKGLINHRFGEAGRVYVRPQLHSSPAGDWLREIGFFPAVDLGPSTAVNVATTAMEKVRAEVKGALEASAVPPGQYLTDLLNLDDDPAAATPEAPGGTSEVTSPLRGGPRAAEGCEDGVGRSDTDDDCSDPPDGASPPHPVYGPADLADLPSRGRLQGEPDGPPASVPAGTSPATPQVDDPALRLLLLELAHKTATQGFERPGGAGRACAVTDEAFQDPKGLAYRLIHPHRALGFGQGAPGGGPLAFVTEAGRALLAAWGWAAADATDLIGARKAAGLSGALDTRGPAVVYETSWLNPAPTSPLAGEVETRPEARPGEGSPHRDAFTRQILDTVAADRAESAAAEDPDPDACRVLDRLRTWARSADAILRDVIATPSEQIGAALRDDCEALRDQLPDLLESVRDWVDDPAEAPAPQDEAA